MIKKTHIFFQKKTILSIFLPKEKIQHKKKTHWKNVSLKIEKKYVVDKTVKKK